MWPSNNTYIGICQCRHLVSVWLWLWNPDSTRREAHGPWTSALRMGGHGHTEEVENESDMSSRQGRWSDDVMDRTMFYPFLPHHGNERFYRFSHKVHVPNQPHVDAPSLLCAYVVALRPYSSLCNVSIYVYVYDLLLWRNTKTTTLWQGSFTIFLLSVRPSYHTCCKVTPWFDLIPFEMQFEFKKIKRQQRLRNGLHHHYSTVVLKPILLYSVTRIQKNKNSSLQ